MLPRKLWAKAMRLSGDVGARHLLREGIDVSSVVPMPEAAFDVDTGRDITRLDDRDFAY